MQLANESKQLPDVTFAHKLHITSYMDVVADKAGFFGS